MGVSFMCPNCQRPVDPMTANAVMHASTKQWRHVDCAAAPKKNPPSEPPKTERRRRPRH